MLYMTKSDYEKILAHCKEGLPNESCGLIGGVREGDKKYIRKVYLPVSYTHLTVPTILLV